MVVKTVLGSQFGVGEFTTHFRTYFSGDWDVHRGYDLAVDPWPDEHTPKRQAEESSGRGPPFGLAGLAAGPSPDSRPSDSQGLSDSLGTSDARSDSRTGKTAPWIHLHKELATFRWVARFLAPKV